MLKKKPPAFAKATVVRPAARSLAYPGHGRRFTAFGLTDLLLFVAFALTYEATLRASKRLRPFLRLRSGQVWTDPSERRGFFGTFPHVVRSIDHMAVTCLTE